MGHALEDVPAHKDIRHHHNTPDSNIAPNIHGTAIYPLPPLSTHPATNISLSPPVTGDAFLPTDDCRELGEDAELARKDDNHEANASTYIRTPGSTNQKKFPLTHALQ